MSIWQKKNHVLLSPLRLFSLLDFFFSFSFWFFLFSFSLCDMCKHLHWSTYINDVLIGWWYRFLRNFPSERCTQKSVLVLYTRQQNRTFRSWHFVISFSSPILSPVGLLLNFWLIFSLSRICYWYFSVCNTRFSIFNAKAIHRSLYTADVDERKTRLANIRWYKE